MFGTISKMRLAPGVRDSVISIFSASLAGMPACLSPIVATDPADPDLWVTEVWRQRREPQGAAVPCSGEAAIAGAPLMIAGFEMR